MKIVRCLGTLLTDFYRRNLEYAEYADSEGYIPTLIISKMDGKTNRCIRVTLVSDGFNEEFIVCKDNVRYRYYWFIAYSDEVYDNYTDMIDTLQGLELYLMAYLDTERVWDTIVEF